MEQTIHRTDMLTIAKLVAREKGIDIVQILEALECAIEKAAASRYGADFDIRAHIDRETGAANLARYTEVVENEDDVEDEMKQVPKVVAKVSHPDLAVGEFIIEPLPPLEFGRIAAQTAKQVIVQKVREAEQEKQYEEYKDRIGQIIVGTVKRAEYSTVTVDLGIGEAVVRATELIGREQFRRGDRLKAYILDVRREQRGPQIFLSRAHPNFLCELFKQEVPEIEEGTIEILRAVREPGSRAKICVRSNDSSLDPVGSCVGMRGSRVQAVVSELGGEKIDILEYAENLQTMVKKALQPAEIARVIINEEEKKVEVVVPEDQLSLAIGRRGQNVRLASKLLEVDLDIITQEVEQQRREAEYSKRSALFTEVLKIDELTARLLVTEGYISVEDIALVPLEELKEVKDLDEKLLEKIHADALKFIAKKEKDIEKSLAKMEVKQDLIDFLGDAVDSILVLGENKIKALEDLADLSSDELVEILKVQGITGEEADNIIMAARQSAGWFEDDDQQQNEDGAGDDGAGDDGAGDDAGDDAGGETQKD